MAEIFQDDTGTVVEVTVKEGGSALDISSATTKNIIIKKPDGSKLTKAASFKTDGTDGIIKFTSLVTDFAASGDYKLQVYIVLPSGSWHSTRKSFIVEFNL